MGFLAPHSKLGLLLSCDVGNLLPRKKEVGVLQTAVGRQAT